MADDSEISEIEHEIVAAKRDLRETWHQINHRVEEGVARLRPDRGIREHPLTAACVAGALGFAFGSDSSEGSAMGLLLLGAAIMFSRREAAHSNVAARNDNGVVRNGSA